MSVIIPDKKVLFIHIPRTGGTSMHAFLPISTDGHSNLKFYYDKYGNLDDYFKFAFVRNPYDRVASGVALYLNLGGITKNDKEKRDKINDYIAFNHNRFNEHSITKTQKSFVELYGNAAMDFIGKFENLKEDWAKVSEKIGVNPKLPCLNASGSEWEGVLDQKSRHIIKENHRVDFETFDYL